MRPRKARFVDDSEALCASADSRSLRVPMPPHPIAAEQARALAETILEYWGLGLLRDDTLLVVSELVTNAVKQRDPFVFTLRRKGDAALIEVTDTSPGKPEVRNAAETETGGRGLLLVEAISAEWGVRYEADGEKTVWAKICR